jgi:cation diffusion facilitator CzcD-associated flavoprotein CzcO
MPHYSGSFSGPIVHSHSYQTPFDPIDLRGKRVVIVGMGNSAMDIASEVSIRAIASKVWVSNRRATWVMPKFHAGKVGYLPRLPARTPQRVKLAIGRYWIRKYVGKMEDYGLPRPEHKPLTSHPSVSQDFLGRVASGDVTPKPAIAELAGDTVRFADGSVENVDVIICATGYNISFPFFVDSALQPDDQNRFPLFKRMIRPGYENLFFMGLGQVIPTIITFAEVQASLVVEALQGRYGLPTSEEMWKTIERDDLPRQRRYYQSPRHTIQVDGAAYQRDFQRELRRGRHRARSSGIGSPARPSEASEMKGAVRQ